MSAESGGAADEIVPAADPSQKAVSVPETPGALLRAAREQRGLSIQQAADELHLDARLIGAIESNNFQALGAPVYAKGHLRKYASLMGLSPDVVIAHYLTLADVPAAPVVAPLSTMPPPRKRISLRVPFWIVVALAVGAVLWGVGSWLLDKRESAQPAAAVSSNLAVPLTVEPGTSTTAVQVPVQQPESQQTPPTQEVAAAPAAGAVSVRLQFNSASWAEVYDATNKRLMFDVGQPGTTRSLSGAAPLRVNLGVAAAVGMEVNSRPVTIPRRSGKDAARFEVAADGSVR